MILLSTAMEAAHDLLSTTETAAASVDLLSTAMELRAFLRAVHVSRLNANGVLYQHTPQLDEAIRSYTHEFMPTLAAGGSIEPALDVAWVWFLHRLSPAAYERDCVAAFGRLIDADAAAPLPGWRTESPCAHTRPAAAKRSAASGGAALVVSCDLTATAERQGGFLWQVRWPEYDSSEFLADACERYQRLLRLWAAWPKAFLVPTYDQDLVWHAHMAHPVAYSTDCARLCGRLIDHDDSVTDRSMGSRLNTSAQSTAELWERAYPGDTWAKPGGMFRGHPPDWYWQYPHIAALPGGAVPAGLPELGDYDADCARDDGLVLALLGSGVSIVIMAAVAVAIGRHHTGDIYWPLGAWQNLVRL